MLSGHLLVRSGKRCEHPPVPGPQLISRGQTTSFPSTGCFGIESAVGGRDNLHTRRGRRIGRWIAFPTGGSRQHYGVGFCNRLLDRAGGFSTFVASPETNLRQILIISK